MDCPKYSELADARFKFFLEEVCCGVCACVCMRMCLCECVYVSVCVCVCVYLTIYLSLQILPHHSSPLMAQTAIFIGSYPDFVRVRNYMMREEKSFTQICE